MMLCVPALELGIPFQHREVRDPREPPEALVDELQLPSEVEPQETEDAGDLCRLARPEERRGARHPQRLEYVRGQELRDRRADLTVGAEDDPGEPLGAPALDDLLELRDLAARKLLRNRDV